MSASGLQAQVNLKNASNKLKKLYGESEAKLQAQDNQGAIKILNKAIKIEPGFIDAYIRLGDIHYFMREFEPAINHMNQAIKLDSFYTTRTYYIGGLSSRGLGNFSDAISFLTVYSDYPGLHPKKKQEIEGIILNCRFAEEAVLNPVPFLAKNLGDQVNTVDHEYLPSLVAEENKMLFTRRFNKSEDIFNTHFSDGDWEKATPLSGQVNTPHFGEGSQAISPDGKTLYFAADYGANGKRGWDIYMSEWKGENWSDPILLDYPLNTVYYESQPSISADGRSLFFCSRRPGGSGGKDIWVSQMQTDCRWGEPKNLGPVINTPKDEEVPFIHPDNQTLYFGSDGHIGIGGSDLYISRKDVQRNWTTPVNMGYPMNTLTNEGSLFVSTNGEKGYFSSDLLGGSGGFDLYTFELWEAVKPKPVTWLRAYIYDAETREKITSDFELYDLATNELIVSSKCHSYLKTDFLIVLPSGHDYALNIEKPGYLFHSEHIQLSEKKEYEPDVYHIYLKKLKPGNVLILQNILFRSKSFELVESSVIELDKLVDLLERNPGMKVEISGHTDNVGSDSDNLKLSESRAQSVYEYIIDKGILKSRLTFSGYGESEPIEDNSTEEGRAKNRRTEIKILEL